MINNKKQQQQKTSKISNKTKKKMIMMIIFGLGTAIRFNIFDSNHHREYARVCR